MNGFLKFLFKTFGLEVPAELTAAAPVALAIKDAPNVVAAPASFNSAPASFNSAPSEPELTPEQAKARDLVAFLKQAQELGFVRAPVAVAQAAVQAPVVARGVTYTSDRTGMLIPDVMPDGTPGTVTLPRTGHVVVVADPAIGFMSYCARVFKQCGAPNASNLGILFNGTDYLFAEIGGYKDDGSNWPEAADRFFNTMAYMKLAQLVPSAPIPEWRQGNAQFAAQDAAVVGRRTQAPTQPVGPTVAEAVRQMPEVAYPSLKALQADFALLDLHTAVIVGADVVVEGFGPAYTYKDSGGGLLERV